MCRLLGFVGAEPMSVEQALGAEPFAEFTGLTRLHADGWGMAWYDGERLERAYAPDRAATDPVYRRLAGTALGTAGMTHLRWATDGLAIDGANTHPFLDHGLALAHNGSIAPIDDLTAMLTPAARSQLIGTTDSERYFRLVLDRIADEGDVVAGVRRAVEQLLTNFASASMNALILHEHQLIAVHASSRAVAPLADIEEVFPGMVGAPPDHAEAYFRLRYRIDDGLVLVTSTGISGSEWTALPANCLLVVDRSTLATQVIELSASVGSR